MKIEEKIKNKYLYKSGFNFFKLFYFVYQYLKTKKILKQRVFYSNWGLDMLADDFFKNKKNGIYIDVGSHQPFLNNNTYRLYKRGWTGINIDLDFNTIDMFNKSMVTTDFGAGNGVVEKENTPRVNSVTNSSVSSLGWEMGDDRYERAKSHSAFSLLNMVVSPYKFRSLKTIGHTIEVLFPNNIHNGNGENTFDTKRSGLYVITHSRLSITPGKATYTMNAVSKVSNNV